MANPQEALRHIWKIIAEAESSKRRLTRDEMLNVMQWCNAGLDHPANK